MKNNMDYSNKKYLTTKHLTKIYCEKMTCLLQIVKNMLAFNS